jgi:hypothetical protein
MSAVTMTGGTMNIPGRSALDIPLSVTFFRDHAAQSKRTSEQSLRALIPMLRDTTAPSKAELPWLKLATFGDARTPRGSLRHDGNITAVTGIEADYDGEAITVDRARQILANAGIAAIIYTSPSHLEDTPRWRVLCPLAHPIPSHARAGMVARLNGLFVGALATESFTASQAYYYGSVRSNPSHEVVAIEGRALDEAPELDDQAVGRRVAERQDQAAQAPAPRPTAVTAGDGTPYALAALARECAAIRNAGQGYKWATINRAAYSIGGIVTAGELHEGPAIAALRDAVHSIRGQCEDFAHALRTLETGFADGKAAPRHIPEAPRLIRRVVKEYAPTRPEPPPLTEAPDHWAAEPEPDIGLQVERVEASAGVAKSQLWIDNDTWDAAAIPRRPWLAPGYLMRGAVSVLSGQGAGGKSSITVAWTISAASGEALGTFQPVEPLKVVNYNTEDDQEEQQRRYSAALIATQKRPGAVMPNITRCGPEQIGTLFERNMDTGRITPTAAMEELEALCVESGADLLVCDPLAELHNAEENDNTAMRAVIAAFRSLAKRLHIAVLILHHDRKGNSNPGDMDRVRGASAISGAVRVMLTLTTMSEDEANKLGIPLAERRRHFRIDGAKSNYAPTQEAEWWRLAPYEIPNGEHVAACLPWQPPTPWANLQWDQVTTILDVIEAGPGRAGALWMVDKKGAYWAGHVITKHSSLNDKQAGEILKEWEENGVLERDSFTNEKGNERIGYRVNRVKFSEMRQQKEAA